MMTDEEIEALCNWEENDEADIAFDVANWEHDDDVEHPTDASLVRPTLNQAPSKKLSPNNLKNNNYT